MIYFVWEYNKRFSKVVIIMTVIKKEDILKVIGNKIQEARIRKGFTQEYVAEQIDKSADTFRGIENGRSIGSVGTLLNICNLLDITMDDIFCDLLFKKEVILDRKLYEDFQKLNLDEKELVEDMIKHMIAKKNK